MITPDGDNLVLVLSLPRSGSTLLSVLLGSHSRVLAPPEPWLLLPLLHLDKPATVDPDFGSAHAAIATREFLGAERLTELSRRFACEAYNAALADAQKDVFLDKTPRYYHILADIERVLPKCRRIWLLRDPLDIAASYKSSWNIPAAELGGSPLTQYTFDFLVGLPRIADAISHPKQTDFVIRYEELVSEPKRSLVRLSEFLGLPFEEQTANLHPSSPALAAQRLHNSGDRKILGTSKVHSNSVGAWRTQLQLTDLQVLSQHISSEMLRTLGYSTTAAELVKTGVKLHRESYCAPRRRLALATKQNPDSRERHELHARIRSLETELTDRDRQLRHSNELFQKELANLRRDLSERHNHNEQLTGEVTRLRNTLSDLDRQLREANEIYRKELEKAHDLATELEQKNKDLGLELGERESRLAALDASLTKTNKLARSVVAEKEAALQAAHAQVKQFEVWLTAAEGISQELRGQIEMLTGWVTSAREESSSLRQQTEVLSSRVRELESESLDRHKQIETLTALLKQTQRESLSRYEQIQSLTRTVRKLQGDENSVET